MLYNNILLFYSNKLGNYWAPTVLVKYPKKDSLKSY